MKIIIINGSYSGNKGYTYFLSNKICEGIRSVGSECEIVNLIDLKINRCLACLSCQQPENLRKCVYDGKDDVSFIINKIKESNLIIYASPVYFFSISGLLKIFIERLEYYGWPLKLKLSKSKFLSHEIDPILSKPMVILTCLNNIEDNSSKNVIDYFKIMSLFFDAPIRGILIRNGGRMSGSGKNELLEKKYPRIYQVYNAYINVGKELGKSGQIQKSTLKAANQEIISTPFFSRIKNMKIFKNIIYHNAIHN